MRLARNDTKTGNEEMNLVKGITDLVYIKIYVYSNTHMCINKMNGRLKPQNPDDEAIAGCRRNCFPVFTSIYVTNCFLITCT